MNGIEAFSHKGLNAQPANKVQKNDTYASEKNTFSSGCKLNSIDARGYMAVSELLANNQMRMHMSRKEFSSKDRKEGKTSRPRAGYLLGDVLLLISLLISGAISNQHPVTVRFQ